MVIRVFILRNRLDYTNKVERFYMCNGIKISPTTELIDFSILGKLYIGLRIVLGFFLTMGCMHELNHGIFFAHSSCDIEMFLEAKLLYNYICPSSDLGGNRDEVECWPEN